MRKASGLSLLILIFVTLCLGTFALLSLSESKADQTLSMRSAERTKEYYTAVTTANRVLSDIDTVLTGNLKQAEASALPEKTYREKNRSLPSSVTELTWFGDDTLTFSVPVSDAQSLSVLLSIAYPKLSSDPLFRILKWELVNTSDWNPDTKQHLFQG